MKCSWNNFLQANQTISVLNRIAKNTVESVDVQMGVNRIETCEAITRAVETALDVRWRITVHKSL